LFAREAVARAVLAEEGNGVADAGMPPRGGMWADRRSCARETGVQGVLTIRICEGGVCSCRRLT